MYPSITPVVEALFHTVVVLRVCHGALSAWAVSVCAYHVVTNNRQMGITKRALVLALCACMLLRVAAQPDTGAQDESYWQAAESATGAAESRESVRRERLISRGL